MTRKVRQTLACISVLALSPLALGELKPLQDDQLREVSGQGALQFSSTDMSYDLNHLTGINFTKNALLGFTRTEERTVTEHVDSTVYRFQINGDGELHAFSEGLTAGDYAGSNNSIYKDENGNGIPEIALRNFGFGNSAAEPFYIEDPYIEIQKQNHPDGTQTFRGMRIGFGNVRGPTPVTIDSVSGYISTLSLLPDLGGLIAAQVYGTGTKDTFVNVLDAPPDGSGNYPQSPAPGTIQCNGASCGATPNNVGLVDGSLLGGDYNKGGKEVNLSHVESLTFHDVKNFYISYTQGGGNSFVNDDGTVNGAMWSQHMDGVIPESRPDLPGWNMVAPFNDPSNPTAGYVEAHTDIAGSLAQILTGVGDDNPRQQYHPLF
ncbi:hypothetical protein QQM79_09220 [Marinobacteraceae bacterium S3BR75-40.1]